MEAIFDGLPQPIKENIGPCLSAKEIWIKWEKICSVEQRTETSFSEFENISENEGSLLIETIISENDSDIEGGGTKGKTPSFY